MFAVVECVIFYELQDTRWQKVTRIKYFVNEINRNKRLEFAKEYANLPMEYWNRVILIDESKFNIFGSDGRCTVRRKRTYRI